MIDLHKCRSPWLRPELIASWIEFIVVILFFDGYCIYGSTRALLDKANANNYGANYFASPYSLLCGTTYTAAFLAVMLYFFYRRGWASGDFKIKIGGVSSLQGIILFFAAKTGYAITLLSTLYIIFICRDYYYHPQFLSANQPHVTGSAGFLGWTMLIISSIFTAYSEELLNMGYAFNQIAARRGPLVALFLTVALRMSCHTYQGLIHVVAIGIVFLIFGIYYWYARNLWPLILAHIFFDTFPMDILKLGLSFFRHA